MLGFYKYTVICDKSPQLLDGTYIRNFEFMAGKHRTQ